MRAFLIHWRKRKKEFRNITEWWDKGKIRVKRLTITHCVLIQELTELKRQQRPGIAAVEEIETRLNEIDTAKAQGIQVRSRATWGRERQKANQIFLLLGKEKAT